MKWLLYATFLPDAVTNRCGCSRVGDAYSVFLEAKGPRFFKLADDGNCISKQLAEEFDPNPAKDPHRALEARFIDKWLAGQDTLIPQILAAGLTDAQIDFIKAADGIVAPASPGPLTELNVDTDVTYRKNNLAGGLLFGAGHDPSDPPNSDSEFGDDTRRLTATLIVHRADDGRNPTVSDVEETVTFNYVTRDALDFCPANTTRATDANFTLRAIQYDQILSDLSRLEASGMARDVGFEVRYHRTQKFPHRVSKPVPPSPSAPAPTPRTPTPIGPKTPTGPKTGLTSPRFMGPDGRPDPTLEACLEDRARLHAGSPPSAVAKVQQALIDIEDVDLDLGPTGADGIYGHLTAEAIKKLKREKGLGSESFGDVGPGTMRFLDDQFAAA